jgi:hypothetical protein
MYIHENVISVVTREDALPSAAFQPEVQERGLARAGLSVQHQRSAVPGARVTQEALEHLSLSLSAEYLLSQQPRCHIRTLAALSRSLERPHA